MSSFIPEVCDALYDALADYIKIPNTEQKWMDIKTGFQLKWNFPGCIGAIDGKHINLRAPACSGSEFYNYKKTFSIVLLACVDDDYSFTYIDIGAKGRYSDGGVFSNCSLKRAIDDGSLNIPAESVIVADAAFPLQNNIMKPYPGNNLTTRQKIFNYRLSRARRIVENAFGILASRFRIFEKPIANNVKNTIKITRTSCALHNWLRKNDSNYLEPGLADYEDISTGITINGSWRQVPLRNFEDMGEDNTLTENGTTIRDRFADYFSSEGAVPWQTRFIH
nr:protein ALP1-like [Vanessa tameamea]